jgi:hypothetical protein
MHSARLFLSNHSCTVNHLPLSNADAMILNALLEEDAYTIWSRGLLSYLDCINSVTKQSFGWAVVKAYYACFYFLISEFCLENFCICRASKVPNSKRKVYSILKARAGKTVQRANGPEAGSTHGSAVILSKQHLENFALRTQKIQNLDAIEWIKDAREKINYKEPLLNIDDQHSYFLHFKKNESIWALLDLYGGKDRDSYCFLEDHAVLGMPAWLSLSLGYRLKQKDAVRFDSALKEATSIGSPYRTWEGFRRWIHRSLER